MFFGTLNTIKAFIFAENEFLGQKSKLLFSIEKPLLTHDVGGSYGGDDGSGNHHITWSSDTAPNLVSRERPNPEIPWGGAICLTNGLSQPLENIPSA